MPPCTPSVALRLEAGLVSVRAQVKVLMINYWLKLIFFSEGLEPLTHLDAFQSDWKSFVVKEMQQIGFSPNIFIAMGYTNTKAAVKCRICVIERQDHVSQMGTNSVVTYSAFTMSSYFSSLMSTKIIQAFTLARLNMLPSKLLDGKFQNIPFSECLCPCKSNQVETVTHVLYACLLYTSPSPRD